MTIGIYLYEIYNGTMCDFFLLMLEFMYAKWQVFLHTGSYLNGEKCIYKSVQRIVSSLIAASYNKDCEIFLCICKYQFSTLSNGKFVLVTSAYMAQTIFLGLYLFTIVNLCNQYSPSFLDRFCYLINLVSLKVWQYA